MTNYINSSIRSSHLLDTNHQILWPLKEVLFTNRYSILIMPQKSYCRRSIFLHHSSGRKAVIHTRDSRTLGEMFYFMERGNMKDSAWFRFLRFRRSSSFQSAKKERAKEGRTAKPFFPFKCARGRSVADRAKETRLTDGKIWSLPFHGLCQGGGQGGAMA